MAQIDLSNCDTIKEIITFELRELHYGVVVWYPAKLKENLIRQMIINYVAYSKSMKDYILGLIDHTYGLFRKSLIYKKYKYLSELDASLKLFENNDSMIGHTLRMYKQYNDYIDQRAKMKYVL